MQEFLMNVDVSGFQIFSFVNVFLLLFIGILIAWLSEGLLILFEIKQRIKDFFHRTIVLFFIVIVSGGFIQFFLFKVYLKDFKTALIDNTYFSLGRNGNSLSIFEVYKVKETEVKETVSFFEKSNNGLEISKSKEIVKKLEDKEVLFTTTCKDYSIQQCIEKAKELLKDEAYALKIDQNKEVKL